MPAKMDPTDPDSVAKHFQQLINKHARGGVEYEVSAAEGSRAAGAGWDYRITFNVAAEPKWGPSGAGEVVKVTYRIARPKGESNGEISSTVSPVGSLHILDSSRRGNMDEAIAATVDAVTHNARHFETKVETREAIVGTDTHATEVNSRGDAMKVLCKKAQTAQLHEHNEHLHHREPSCKTCRKNDPRWK